MSRQLLVLFLTVFISLVGFGIIIPLLPFYASTFGASPTTIGLLFASFSAAQLVAAPVLGDWSDRFGRRPVLLLSLFGTVVSFVMLALAQGLTLLFLARIVDGLSGGNITTVRAYIADITTPENRSKSYGIIGAGFGLGFTLGPGIGAALAHVSYTAPIWAAAALSFVAMALAWIWLPETVRHVPVSTSGAWRQLPSLFARKPLGRVLWVDLAYWTAFAVYQTTFALFGQRRFGWDATHIGYILTVFGVIGIIVQGGLVGLITRAIGDARALVIGLCCAAGGLTLASLTHHVPTFVATLVPAAVGIGLCNPTLTSLISRSASTTEQGLVQGAAGTLESLGRIVGPVAGNGLLEGVGEGAAYGAASLLLFATAVLAWPLARGGSAVQTSGGSGKTL
jgi:DHA1 family tetracycline resistance protein-like MFS transporter